MSNENEIRQKISDDCDCDVFIFACIVLAVFMVLVGIYFYAVI